MTKYSLARLSAAAVLGLAAAVWLPTVASAADDQPVVSKSETGTVTGVIEEIDRGNREIAIKESDGNIFTLPVSEQAKNFDELQVGDEVSMEYTIGLTVALMPVTDESAPSRAEFSKFTEDAVSGDKVAGGTMTHYTTVVAVVENLDPQTRMVTLRGPNRSATVAVGPEVNLDRVKEGDRVVAAIERSLAVSVTRTGAQNKFFQR